MMAPNYPNHPLFRITPLLNDGQNRVMHDEYTSRLIGRIRAGRYTSELWDCNSLYLDYGERLAAVRAARPAFKSRYTMTMQEIRDYQNTPEAKAERAKAAEELRVRRAEKKAQREAEETKLAAHRRAMAEEKWRFAEEYAAAQAKRKAEQKQRDLDWEEREAALAAEGEQRRQERSTIMAGPWECSRCLRPAQVVPWPGGLYELTCPRCARSARTDHATMLSIVARKIQLKPVNPSQSS